tara:strand:+ start:2277 stop:2525 length:249 start_codon:yes stop_codon:yes gene_type:complete
MRKNSTYSQQFINANENETADEWDEDDDDDFGDDEATHARKEHQSHRGRGKGQVRRNIENFKDQQMLKELLGDDYDDYHNLV